MGFTTFTVRLQCASADNATHAPWGGTRLSCLLTCPCGWWAMQDPADEDEQARVMSQAQALLDCTADLVEHCGVLATVDVLQVTPFQGLSTYLKSPAISAFCH